MFHNPVRQPRPLLGPRRFDIVLSNTAVLVASVFVVSLSVPYRRKVADIEQAEKEKMRSKCNKIIDHGINCFINRQLIYNFPVRSWIANKVHIQRVNGIREYRRESCGCGMWRVYGIAPVCQTAIMALKYLFIFRPFQQLMYSPKTGGNFRGRRHHGGGAR